MSKVTGDIEAMRWINTAFQILSMDDVWTAHLAGESLTHEEMNDLVELGESLRNAWEWFTYEGTLHSIGKYMKQHAERGAQAAREAGSRLVSDTQTLQEFMSDTVAALENSRDPQAEQLEAKTGALRAGKWVPGDLLRDTRCLILASVVGGAYFTHHHDVAKPLEDWFLASGCLAVLLRMGVVKGKADSDTTSGPGG
ncbi:hypothetical protein [Streptomyces sp. ADI95-17]|uniref:hypothetical protein n=1 Tax=Streptomyces sp. ADI95-17 TaxID=1522759 RepID=UPI000F5BAF13|nr:hypothetical protein [Streptomyces sp. ADI95-17]RPK74471.1 hypothetical protein EES42_08375 [Streptomyces sp. ADI95-17]